MASRLPKSSLVALRVTVVATAMALGGPAYAQGGAGIFLNARPPAPPAMGSLMNGRESEATDKAAIKPASDEAPAPSAPSADEQPAEADEGTTTIQRSRATYDSDLAEPE